jgi:ATP-dependent Lon protease
MTGEISLQGDVKPIGGLPEKLMAAQRAGVRRVFIPAENLEDLRDVAAEVRDSLEIIPVERAEEVLTQLGIMERPAAQDAKQAG